MKKVLLLLLLSSSSCFAQFKLSYREIMKQYHPKETGIKDGHRTYSRIVKDSTIVDYLFTLADSSLATVVINKKSGFSKKEIKEFKNEYLNTFNPNRTRNARETENIIITYDEEKPMMMFQVFSETDPKKTILVSFTNNKKFIEEIVSLMNLGY